MPKINAKRFPILVSLIVVITVSTSILLTHRKNNISKTKALENYYAKSYENWKEYQEEYAKAVEELKEQNRKEMETTKENYNTLLAQQSELIAEHTRTIEQTSYVPQEQASGGNSSSSSKSSTQVIKVPKPRSAPSTGAS